MSRASLPASALAAHTGVHLHGRRGVAGSHPWLWAAALAVLAGGCTRIDVGAQRYVCVPDGLDPQQCPGGFRCALDGFCVDPSVGAELRCETRADCTGGWQCSLEQRCVDPAVGKPLRCLADADCTARWKCTREGQCADPSLGKDLPCATSDDCTGGWHCGVLGRCYDRLDAGALGCRRDSGVDDCAPQWRCGVDERCQDTRVAAAYACVTDEHCERGWRCAPERRCVDPQADALRPTGDGGLSVTELGRFFPANPTAVAVDSASLSLCGEPYGLRSSTSAAAGGWVRLVRPDDDTGFPVMLGPCGVRPDQRYGLSWQRPSPGRVVELADLVGEQSRTYALLEDGGLLRWDTSLSGPGESLTNVPLPFAPTRMRWSSATRGRLLLADESRVATLELDGGLRLTAPAPSPIVDFVEVYTGALTSDAAVVIASEDTVRVEDPGGQWTQSWLAPDTAGQLDSTFSLGPARRSSGESGFVYLRDLLDGGVGGGVTLFGSGNGTRPVPSFHADCARGVAALDLGVASTTSSVVPRVRLACLTSDFVPVAFDETALSPNPLIGPLPPGYFRALKGHSRPGTVAWALPSGAVAAWGGTEERPQDLDELSALPTVPDRIFGNSTVPVVTIDAPLGGANAVCRFAPPLGMVCTRTNLPIVAVSRASPELVLTDFGSVESLLPPLLVVRLDETSRFDRARIPAQRDDGFGPPYTLAARNDGDAGLVLASSNDTLLFAQVGLGPLAATLDTRADFTALPRLTYATVPQSRAPITSSVLLPRTDAGVQPFAEAYVVAAGRVYRVLADNAVVWRADEVLPVTAEAISVWSDGPRVRVSFRDGTVFSLPSRLQVAPPITAGASTVVDLADACGQSFALTGSGLFRLESAGEPQGRWTEVRLPVLTDEALRSGRLFADARGLLVFLPEGRVLRVEGFSCLN